MNSLIIHIVKAQIKYTLYNLNWRVIRYMGIFLYLLFSDCFTVFNTKYRFIIFNTISAALLGIIGFGIIFSIESAFYNSAGSSVILIAAAYICSIIFAALSLIIYQNRESYYGKK